MVKHSYFFETENQLTQFVAAFDDIFVWRYDRGRNEKEKIKVRYVFGPKQRVLYDIVNQAKNITLPVISMEQKNIKRDSSRVQFKSQNFTYPTSDKKKVAKIPSPVPVSYDVEISIVCGYKSDIDQIVQNFIPWCNPYFIISWKVPEEFGLDFIDELRTECTWSGNIDYENPTNIDHSEKYKIVGNTSFNIKGWLFPAHEIPSAPIYVVNNNFVAVDSGATLGGYDDYWSLSGYDTTESIMISAYPEFTNYFLNGRPYDYLRTYDINDKTFTFYGKRFSYNNSWYLSSNTTIEGLAFEEVQTAKFPLISAYRLPDSLITTVNDNIASIALSANYLNLSGGDYTFVTSNSAGWVSSSVFVIDTYNLIYNGIVMTYNGEEWVYN